MTNPNELHPDIHRQFARSCFNDAWKLMELAKRKKSEDAQMLTLAHTSLWHWQQLEECSELEISVGYWQISRIYSQLADSQMAIHFGKLCLRVSRKLPPFYLGYAYEACARGYAIAGNNDEAQQLLELAHTACAQISELEQNNQLEKDLHDISQI